MEYKRYAATKRMGCEYLGGGYSTRATSVAQGQANIPGTSRYQRAGMGKFRLAGPGKGRGR